MKLVKQIITQSRSVTMSPNDYFMAHFAKDDYQLEQAYGDLKTVLTARLTLEMKKERHINPLVYDPTFEKLRDVILYERPGAPVAPPEPEPEPQITEPKP